MGFVLNKYAPSRGFVRFHYDDCPDSKADRPRERWKPESWYDCDTIAEVVDWLERHRPNDEVRMCRNCMRRHGTNAKTQITSSRQGSVG